MILGEGDLAAMAGDIQAIINENPQTIIIRRDETPLPAQLMRIERPGLGQATNQSGQAGQENRGRAVVLGSKTLDIQTGDVFNDSAGTLYRVTFVRTNRQICVQAEAEAVQ